MAPFQFFMAIHEAFVAIKLSIALQASNKSFINLKGLFKHL